jgi:hypothetical protein
MVRMDCTALQVEILLCQIQDNETNTDMQVEACEHLCELFQKDHFPAGVDLHNVAHVLVSCIKPDDKPTRLFKAVAVMLERICGQGNNVKFFVQAGVSRLMHAMTTFRQDIGLQIQIWATLGILCTHSVDMGSPFPPTMAKHVCTCMAENMSNRDLQEAGAFFLGCMCAIVRSENERLALLHEGVIQAIVKAAKVDTADMGVYATCCRALERITAKDEKKVVDMMWKAKALDVIMKALKFGVGTYRYDQDHSILSMDAKVQRMEMMLACSLDVIVTMYQQGIEAPCHQDLTVLTQILHQFPGPPALQLRALMALAFTINYGVNVARLFGPECLGLVLRIMAQQEQKLDFVIRCTMILSCLLNNEPNIACFLNNNGVQILARCLDMHHRDETVAIRSVLIINPVAKIHDTRVKGAMRAAGCARAIAKTMLAHIKCTEEKSILHLSCSALCFLTLDDVQRDVQTRFVTEGVAEALMTCMPLCKHCYHGIRVLDYMMHDNVDNMRAFGQRAMCIISAMMFANGDNSFLKYFHCVAFVFVNTMIAAKAHGLLVKLQDGFGQGGGIEGLSMSLSRLIEGAAGDMRAVAVCSAFRNMAFAVLDHPHNQNRCRKAGAIPKILRLMTEFKSNKDVYRAGCCALFDIGSKHRENAAIISAGGGMQHVTETAKSFRMVDGIRRIMQVYSGTHEEGDIVKKGCKACVACGKTSAHMGGKKLLKCSVCTVEPHYCSVECQRVCWRAHKEECHANKQEDAHGID